MSLENFPLPTIWHKIVVKPTKGKSRVEYAYTFKNGQPGEAWWTTCDRFCSHLIVFHLIYFLVIQISVPDGSFCKQNQGPRTANMDVCRRFYLQYGMDRKDIREGQFTQLSLLSLRTYFLGFQTGFGVRPASTYNVTP